VPKNKIEDLRNHLFETLEALRDDEKPMDLDRAKTIADVARVIVESAKVEVELVKATGERVGTGFLPLAIDELPADRRLRAVNGTADGAELTNESARALSRLRPGRNSGRSSRTRFPTWSPTGRWVYGTWNPGANFQNRTRYPGAYPRTFVERVLAMFPDVRPRQLLHVFAGSLPPGKYARLDVKADLAPEIVGDVYALPALLAAQPRLGPFPLGDGRSTLSGPGAETVRHARGAELARLSGLRRGARARRPRRLAQHGEAAVSERPVAPVGRDLRRAIDGPRLPQGLVLRTAGRMTRRTCRCGCGRQWAMTRRDRGFFSPTCAQRARRRRHARGPITSAERQAWGREGARTRDIGFRQRLVAQLLPLDREKSILRAYALGRQAAYRRKATA
jgi:hypothetical protein